MKAVSNMSTLETTSKQVKITVRNLLTNKQATFTLTDEIQPDTPPAAVEQLIQRALRIFRRGSSPVLEVTKIKIIDKPLKKKTVRQPSPKKVTAIRQPANLDQMDRVLYITPADSRRLKSETIAEKLTDLLNDAPNDQERIDEVLVLIRYTQMMRSSANLKTRNELQQSDFEGLLCQIYQHSHWSDEMIAAFWELRLLLSKGKRKYFAKRLRQEVTRRNQEQGHAYFDQQGHYSDELRVANDQKIAESIHELVLAAYGLIAFEGPLEIAV